MSDERVEKISSDDMRLLYIVLDNFYRVCRGHTNNLKPVDFENAKRIREYLSLSFDDVAVLKEPEIFPEEDEPITRVSAARLQDSIDDMTICHDKLDDKNWSVAEGDMLSKRQMVKPRIERIGTLCSDKD